MFPLIILMIPHTHMFVFSSICTHSLFTNKRLLESLIIGYYLQVNLLME